MMNMKITLLTGKIFDIEKEVDFPLKVVASKQARRLSLRIDVKNRIPVLTVPKLCSKRQALDFVKSQKQWIETHLQKIPEQKMFEENEKISVAGQELIIKHCDKVCGGAMVEDNILWVSGNKEFLSRRVRDFIKEQAQKYLYDLSLQKAKKIGCKVNRVVIKDTKSRWGSCSSLNNINYNWRIMLAPLKVIDYLVAHEVSHLEHQDHSTQFWNCVDDLAEDLEYGKNWLKKNGRYLNQYI